MFGLIFISVVSKLLQFLHPASKLIVLRFHIRYRGALLLCSLWPTYTGNLRNWDGAYQYVIFQSPINPQHFSYVYLNRHCRGERAKKRGLSAFRGTHTTFHPPGGSFALGGKVAEPKFSGLSFTTIPKQQPHLLWSQAQIFFGKNLTPPSESTR